MASAYGAVVPPIIALFTAVVFMVVLRMIVLTMAAPRVVVLTTAVLFMIVPSMIVLPMIVLPMIAHAPSHCLPCNRCPYTGTCCDMVDIIATDDPGDDLLGITRGPHPIGLYTKSRVRELGNSLGPASACACTPHRGCIVHPWRRAYEFKFTPTHDSFSASEKLT